MRFWDSSAVVPLLVPEASSRRLQQVFRTDPVMMTWWAFLRVHPLRTADAVQLAAAFRAAEGRPASLEFVSLDERLAAAARIEGFPVVSA